MDESSSVLLAKIIRQGRVAGLGTFANDTPLVTMVAFVAQPDFSAFMIHISMLAKHTRAIEQNPKVSLLITQADDGRQDPQTLARVSIGGLISVIPQDAPGYASARALYLNRFPQALPLFNFGDFGLYQIVPEFVHYVAGFARAFNLTLTDLTLASQKFHHS